jgi:hypothetical protein
MTSRCYVSLESASKLVEILSVVIGVVISVWKIADAHKSSAEARKLESAKPFLDLRQRLYMEALKTAATLASPEGRPTGDIEAAKRRFRELYISELTMVEAPNVESSMVALAQEIDPDLLKLNAAQKAAYQLAHALRDTFTADWGVPHRRKKSNRSL